MTDEEIKKKIEELEKNKIGKKLNLKIKEMLSFIGFILSVLGGIGYFVTILILVLGTGDLDFQLIGKDGVFFIIGFMFGLFIRSGFYIQGITYAKEEFHDTLKEYYDLKVTVEKEKRTSSFEFKLGFEIFRTTVMQLGTYLIGTVGLIYLAGFSGMNNGVYIGNAISNLFMFTGFGFLALNSAYEKYIIFKIPRIRENIKSIKAQNESQKTLNKPPSILLETNTTEILPQIVN